MSLKLSRKNKIKTNRGITLIALVITIIVLLILAGVTIATLTGENGLLTKVGNAKELSIDGEIGEQVKLAYLEWQTAKMTGTTENANDFIKNSLNSSIGDVEDVTLDNDALTVTILKNNENKIYYYNIKKGAVKQVERTSQSTDIKDSYVGYYADTNEDGIVDGVIFADLLVGNTNGTQWGNSNGTYQILTLEKDVLKKYYISKENYNGIINVVIPY